MQAKKAWVWRSEAGGLSKLSTPFVHQRAADSIQRSSGGCQNPLGTPGLAASCEVPTNLDGGT